jgi:anhydro-N-acetylmuramic acid kinase
MPLLRAIGLMSGTSMDAVDVAFVETDGASALNLGPTGARRYVESERALLRAAVAQAAHLNDRAARPGALADAETLVTDRHAECVETFMRDHSIDRASVDFIGFHGQTVLHKPQRGLTVQIGDGAALARRLRIPVVADMRAADVAAGGEGAPLVPVWHEALAKAAGLELPLAIVNLGGVGNLTFIAHDRYPIAFDTGPANALIDDLMLERTGVACDIHGAQAALGETDEDALAELLTHPYFHAPAPKSLDRNSFSRAAVAGLETKHAAATLTAFTAHSIAKAFALLPQRPGRAIICGGGTRNPTLMRVLAEVLRMPVASADDLGWSADSMEAQAFAYLAVRAARGLPLTFPTTTGAPAPMTGGVIHRP